MLALSEKSLRVEKVSKTFQTEKGPLSVLKDINLEIGQEQFIAIIGPSGCGKSTLLKIIAGLDNDYEGAVYLGEEKVNSASIEKGFIFQEHRLFPWLTVEQNIAANYSLKSADIRRKVDELLELTHLKGFEKSYPRALSGGMSQRVSIARALLREPQVLLLDEPFGALDAFTRTHMQEAILEIWENKKTTMVLVTHDIDEAVFVANKIVIMGAKPGVIRDVIPNHLPYPRKKASEAFQNFRLKVLKEFERWESFALVEGAGI
ncbi:ABC transporter ATP-binding protein [Paenibacillus validus]|uniref:ATP-binding cassette domain-containing protein n=1 Tax=Paenibacillus validus TaxID=44253 RepID=A0A7X2ZB32_9BACL|nr:MULTISPECIES: ABC transporter ATP-binding protein [Paenibacillus]MED4599201.1 ABC transporter ATP-binding protein [Paenibacillus validus]MED4606492.1 ABC transporter ATP-binding protein [Paenibacillus validus]MUG71552.1 ATP-binding cassette domain-containing protein [Paenibacillus validus]